MSADFANFAVLHYFKFMKAMPFYLHTRRTTLHLKNSSAVNCILHLCPDFTGRKPNGKIKELPYTGNPDTESPIGTREAAFASLLARDRKRFQLLNFKP
jgi:hypothetical protein